MPASSHSSTCGLISAAINFCRLRRSSSCSGVNCMTFPLSSLLHTRDAEGAALERAKFCLAADRKAKAQDFAGIAGINQPIVPKPGGSVERRGFAFHPFDDCVFHDGKLGLIDRLAIA